MTPEPKKSAEPVSKTRLRLWLRLLKVSSGIETELRRRLRDGHDTTLPRFDVLAALSLNPLGLKKSALSGYLKESNGYVTGIVDRLTDEGLALRVSIPGDRRAHLVRLTPKGQTAFATLADHHEAWIDELLGGLSAEEADMLNQLLKQADAAKDEA